MSDITNALKQAIEKAKVAIGAWQRNEPCSVIEPLFLDAIEAIEMSHIDSQALSTSHASTTGEREAFEDHYEPQEPFDPALGEYPAWADQSNWLLFRRGWNARGRQAIAMAAPTEQMAPCKACAGSGIGGYWDHGVHEHGEQALEPLRCDKCEGFGRSAAPPSQPEQRAGWVDDGGLVFWVDGKVPADGCNLYSAPPAPEPKQPDTVRVPKEPPDEFLQPFVKHCCENIAWIKQAWRETIAAAPPAQPESGDLRKEEA